MFSIVIWSIPLEDLIHQKASFWKPEARGQLMKIYGYPGPLPPPMPRFSPRNKGFIAGQKSRETNG